MLHTYALLDADVIISFDLLYHVCPHFLEVFTSILSFRWQQAHDVHHLLWRLGGQHRGGDHVDVIHMPLCE